MAQFTLIKTTYNVKYFKYNTTKTVTQKHPITITFNSLLSSTSTKHGYFFLQFIFAYILSSEIRQNTYKLRLYNANQLRYSNHLYKFKELF